MDCLLTMFNILLIIAGVLEYILLGIDFKVHAPENHPHGLHAVDICPFRITSRTPTSEESS